MATIYYEALEVGESYSTGSRTVTEEEIIEFASKYDPQSFHIESEAAEESIYDDLIASGWHTASITMQLFVNRLLEDVAVVGAVGVDELRWRNPVYGGDELSITTTVENKECWDDQKGLVTFDLEAINQNNEIVITRTDLVLIEHGP